MSGTMAAGSMLCAAWGVLVTVPAGQLPVAPTPIAITNVSIVDVRSGVTRADQTVLIREGRIAGIVDSRTSRPPASARVVEGRGKCLIPGLTDAMVHLSWTTASALPLLVANGVTRVVDLGGDIGEIDGWRTGIATGSLIGPRILRAGPMLNGQKFNRFQLVVGGPAEARGVVRTLKQVGVDVVKIHRRVPRDSYLALLDEARRHGLMVVGHIPMTVTPEEASDSGQVVFTHTETLFEGTFAAALKDGELPHAIRRFRAGPADSLFARFARNRNAEIPTLVAYRSIIEASDSTAGPDSLSRYVARSLRDAAKKSARTATAEELAGLRETFAELKQVVGHMNRAGVLLVAGTDVAGVRVPGFTLHDELALLVESGLTPIQALQAATITPATIWGWAEDGGSVEPGKLADLVLLDANPLDDIRNTRRISAVVIAGRVFMRPGIRRLLEEAERVARVN